MIHKLAPRKEYAEAFKLGRILPCGTLVLPAIIDGGKLDRFRIFDSVKDWSRNPCNGKHPLLDGIQPNVDDPDRLLFAIQRFREYGEILECPLTLDDVITWIAPTRLMDDRDFVRRLEEIF